MKTTVDITNQRHKERIEELLSDLFSSEFWNDQNLPNEIEMILTALISTCREPGNVRVTVEVLE